jgi:hypothetical protein
VKIILSPSKHGLIFKPSKRVETLMITCFEMEKLVNYVDMAYIIVVFEENTEINYLPYNAQHLLDGLFDVILEDIPPRFPLMRDIQHCINVIRGALLPNKVSYRTSPIKHTEL